MSDPERKQLQRSASDLPPLGRRELSIMNVVWELGQATVRDVVERLPADLAYTTVLTMMRHLEKKGYLTHEAVGKQYVYRPTVAREDVQRTTVAQLTERLFGGAATELISTVLQTQELTDEEVRELRAVLDRLAKGSPKRE